MEKEGQKREPEELVLEEGEEEEEEEVGLVVRGSKYNIESEISKEVRNCHVEKNGYANLAPVTENGAQDSTFDGDQEADRAEEGEAEIKGCLPRQENCVYYDKDEDGKSTSSSPEKESNDRNPGDVSIKRSLLSDLQYNGNSKDENLSNFNILFADTLPQEPGTVHKLSTVEEIESSDVDLITDGEIDAKDYDVENVIHKQNTHDLYCPNCHSCITRRVILRKRKRRIRISSEDVKRNKLETAIESKSDVSPTQLDSDQCHDEPLISLDDTPISATNDYHRDREPAEVFRCLSCFSVFIPTGSGFKLFKIFGEKGDKQNIRDEQGVRVSKSWFSSIFASDKGSADQGKDHRLDVGKNNNEVILPSSNLCDKSDESLSIQETIPPVHVDSRSIDPNETGSNISTSQNNELERAGKIMNDTMDLSVHAIMGKKGEDTIISVVEAGPTETAESMNLPNLATELIAMEQQGTNAREGNKIEIIKSIVYGGLAESITSLSIVSSAAAAGTATLYIFALSVANIVGGFLIILNHLWELKNDCLEHASNQIMEQGDRYGKLLGRRENFVIHAIVIVLSYTVFALVPPTVYGFSFRKSDDMELKIIAAAAASLSCIVVLATGKVYVQRPPKSYLKTTTFYAVLGFMVSGVSFGAGLLMNRVLEKLGLFQSSSQGNLFQPGVSSANVAAWASY